MISCTSFKAVKLLFLLLIVSYQHLNAQSWHVTGQADFSDDIAWYPTVAADTSGRPYIAYSDISLRYKITVMTYNGINWVPVGNKGFSSSRVEYPTMAIDANSVPYVCYEDSLNGYKANVLKFDGNTWVNVGAPYFTAAEAQWPSMTLDRSGHPYIVFSDLSQAGGGATVMMFNDTNWVTVGTPGIAPATSINPAIAVNDNGTPYIVFSDLANGQKAVVMKFNGTSWVNVGPPASTGTIFWPKIAIDHAGNPYILYSNDGGSLDVKKFNGSNWVLVGGSSLSPIESGDNSDLKLDAYGTPYAVYGRGGQAWVSKFNGVSWQVVGNSGLSNGPTTWATIAITKTNNLFVGYSDYPAGNKSTVMNFKDTLIDYHLATPTAVLPIGQQNNGISLNVFPNPANTEFTVDYSTVVSGNVSLNITNAVGEIILAKSLGNNKTGRVTIPVTQWSRGVYFLNLSVKDQVLHEKLLVQ